MANEIITQLIEQRVAQINAELDLVTELLEGAQADTARATETLTLRQQEHDALVTERGELVAMLPTPEVEQEEDNE